MRRREFISLLGCAMAAWPFVAHGQPSKKPVVGLLRLSSPDDSGPHVAIRQGLREKGYIEGQNVAIEYRYANGQASQLPALAAELVRREVTVIAAVGNASAQAAKAATATIPIVLASSDDPVQLGLVASLNRPGGNVTGVVTMAIELGPKQLELLHELVPAVLTVGALVNPSTPGAAETLERELSAAAGILGLRIKVLRAATEADLHAAFATLVELRAPLVIGADTFFSSRIEQLATLSVSRAVPTIYQYREFAAAGGLMSYGPSRLNTFRQFGVYIGRILAGEKPSDLPIERATKFELVINLKTAKAIGIDVPTTILLRADEVIE